MKKTLLVLAVSLAANVVLVTLLLRRDETPREAPRPAAAKPVVAPAAEAALSAQQQSVLVTGDEAAMKAAGVPAQVVRELLAGRAYVRLQARLAAIPKSWDPTKDYWKRSPWGPMSKTRMTEMQSAQREYSETMHALLGESSDVFDGDAHYAFLPRARREQLRRIELDYLEMQQGIWAEMAGMPMPADQRKLMMLDQEKQRDIRAMLTPAEQVEFDLHASQTAMNIQNSYGPGIQSEADYKRVFALQKAFDDEFAMNRADAASQSPEFWKKRADAERKLQEDVRAALGEEAYATMRRLSDHEYVTLEKIEQRLSLPAGTAKAVYASRGEYAELSQGISMDANLMPADRAGMLRELAKRARADLEKTLGGEGAEAYTRGNQWLMILANGQAFSTDLGAAGSTNVSTVRPFAPKPAEPAAPVAPKG